MSVHGRYAKLYIAATMHRAQLWIVGWEKQADPAAWGNWAPARSIHSYTVCKIRRSASGRWNRRILVAWLPAAQAFAFSWRGFFRRKGWLATALHRRNYV